MNSCRDYIIILNRNVDGKGGNGMPVIMMFFILQYKAIQYNKKQKRKNYTFGRGIS